MVIKKQSIFKKKEKDNQIVLKNELSKEARNAKYSVLPLKDLAIELENDYYAAEEGWYERDIEEQFFIHIKTLIGRGHVVLLQVNGEVSSGKSTIGIWLMMYINNIMKEKQKLNPKYDGKYNLLIYADNTEFWKKSNDLSYEIPGKKGNYIGVCVEIDEENKMIRTGANSTVEQTSYEHKSDVFAQKFIHRIYCTPSGLTDQNCSIIIWCEPAQKEYGFTDCKIKYRNIETGRITTLGRVRISVKELLELEMYQKYKEKKFLRMELFEKNGIRDYRDFTDAEVIMFTYDRLKAKSTFEKIPETKIRSMLSIVLAKRAILYSFLGSDEVIVKVKTMLDLTNDIETTIKKIDKLKTNSFGQEDLQEKKEILIESLDNDRADLAEIIEFYKNRIIIKHKYDSLMDEFEEDADESRKAYEDDDEISKEIKKKLEIE